MTIQHGLDEDQLEVIYELGYEVVNERLKQVARWGQQDHPSYQSEKERAACLRNSYYWKQVNDLRVELDILTWDGILLEEVFEALGEADPLLRREELLQVAAVALAEAEAIDRLLSSEDNPYEVDEEVEAD